MARSFRSWWDRYLVWQRAGGCVEICGKPLTGRWQIHHIVPYVYRARTNSTRCQAVHPKCNQQRGIAMNREKFAPWITWTDAREGLREGLHGRARRASPPKNPIARLSIPPGGARGLHPASHSVGGRYLRLVGDAVVLEPNLYLRNQINKEEKIAE